MCVMSVGDESCYGNKRETMIEGRIRDVEGWDDVPIVMQ